MKKDQFEAARQAFAEQHKKNIDAVKKSIRTFGNTTPDPEEQEIEAAISAIADKHKESIDNAHYNMMATGHAMVVVKDAGKCILTSKFSPSNDEVK